MSRDRLTIALYSNFVMWGWFLYSFTPSVPLITAEQGITKAQAGLHGTAMAIGTVLSALVSARLVDRLGRRGVLLAASGVLAAGVVMLVSGGTLAWSLPGALVTAIGGTLVLSAAQPALAVHHGEASAAAMTEANGVGSAFGLLAPLAVGASVAVGWGWRPAVAVTIALSALAAWLVGSLPARGALGTSRAPDEAAAEVDASEAVAGPTAAAAGTRTAPGFSPAFRYFWWALIAAVAVENATTFWAADLLVTRTGAGPGIATGALAGLIAGMSAARFIVGPLSLRKAPEKLLLVAFAVAAAGWWILWAATTPTLALAGLVIAGFGYGAQYPLSIALVLRASRGRPDRAQARATLGSGIAIGIAPFLLGALADQFGTHDAFVLVPVLLAVGAGAVALGLRSVHRTGA
ncbi:MFS transporter [Pengzhenrongella sicca]|uniref:MFS transporter n=1 Tax=Pengzhenrongella sicca TaxID=2819238 RepID=A0A8A4ZM54_9MICO|nr:MFS transporter [Pengzhenrongella sicca]